MKKTFRLLCCMLALLLAACGKSSDHSPTASTGMPDDATDYEAYSGTLFAETAEGYYNAYEIPGGDKRINLIFFCPRGGDTFQPLCGKPNCLHTNEDCNAWFNGYITYYDGSLYTLDEDGLSVIKMNLDGTDHAVVAKLDTSVVQGRTYAMTYELLHGKLFAILYADESLPAEEQKDHLLYLDLSDLSQKELSAEGLDSVRLDFIRVCNREKVFLDAHEKGTYNDFNSMKLVEVDLRTGAAKTVHSGYCEGVYATDSTLYYYEADEKLIQSWYGVDYTNTDAPGLREYDIKSATVKNCGLLTDDDGCPDYDTDYIYMNGCYREDGSNTLYILSKDFKLLDQIDLPEGIYLSFLASDRLFFCVDPIQYYIDKSEIGSHKLSLKPIQTLLPEAAAD